jgi:hypothetical protein
MAPFEGSEVQRFRLSMEDEPLKMGRQLLGITEASNISRGFSTLNSER